MAKLFFSVAITALAIISASCSNKTAAPQSAVKDAVDIPYIIKEDSASLARKAAKEELKYVLRPCECAKCRKCKCTKQDCQF